MKKMRKGAGRILALLLSFMVIAGMLPEAAPTVLANEHSGQVHVIVENTTYTSKTAPWQGKLVDEWVELEADSTMMSCIVTHWETIPRQVRTAATSVKSMG